MSGPYNFLTLDSYIKKTSASDRFSETLNGGSRPALSLGQLQTNVSTTRPSCSKSNGSLKRTVSNMCRSTSMTSSAVSSSPMLKPNDVVAKQSMQIISGTVPTIFELHKQYSNVSALFEVFANIIRMLNGSYSYERVILLRNESGPVLQAVYYEIDFDLSPEITVGCQVRCVGRFVGTRYHLMKIAAISIAEQLDTIIRLQNLSAYTLRSISDIKKEKGKY